MKPVYDLARHESSIAQWLERLTGILEGHGFGSCWGTEKIYFCPNDLWRRKYRIQSLNNILQSHFAEIECSLFCHFKNCDIIMQRILGAKLFLHVCFVYMGVFKTNFSRLP